MCRPHPSISPPNDPSSPTVSQSTLQSWTGVRWVPSWHRHSFTSRVMHSCRQSHRPLTYRKISHFLVLTTCVKLPSTCIDSTSIWSSGRHSKRMVFAGNYPVEDARNSSISCFRSHGKSDNGVVHAKRRDGRPAHSTSIRAWGRFSSPCFRRRHICNHPTGSV